MTFNNDGVTGSEGGCRITTQCAKGEREIGRTKYRNRSDRFHHATQIGFRHRGALGYGSINTGLHPLAFRRQLGKRAKLAAGSAPLTGEANPAQGGFRITHFKELISQGLYFIGNGIEEQTYGFTVQIAICLKGTFRCTGSLFYFIGAT